MKSREKSDVVCLEKHTPNQFIAKPGQNDWLVGECKTDRDDRIADVSVHRDGSIRVSMSVCENTPWTGRVFKTISYQPNLIILPLALVSEREMIMMLLSDLEAAKKAFEAELAFVEDMKKKVTTGEVICLTFKDRGDGISVAEYRGEKIEAPSDDLDRYPANNESWWCHLVTSTRPAKIALYRKAGTTRVDVEKVMKDGLELFPGLPKELLK